MLVICAVLVHYMSSQKGEFTFPGPITCVANTFSIILLVTFVHHLSLTVTNKETFVEALKVVDKPSNVKIGICLYTSMCVCVCVFVCVCMSVCVCTYVYLFTCVINICVCVR